MYIYIYTHKHTCFCDYVCKYKYSVCYIQIQACPLSSKRSLFPGKYFPKATIKEKVITFLNKIPQENELHKSYNYH